MREWIDLFETTERMPYGYWISPNGDPYPVGFERHADEIYDIENTTQGDAVWDGWVRVVSPNKTWSIEASALITSASISKLRALMTEHPAGAHIELHTLDPDEDPLDYTTETPQQTCAVLTAHRRGYLLTDEDLARFRRL